jgi:transcription elongation factor Elf1
MTSINDKLGIKRAGKRAMMKLPTNRSEAVLITSAQCPSCGRRGQATASKLKAGHYWCRWCSATYLITAP